jgi:pimeloyl-ACP methyl ester carboxylesterase
LTPPREVTLDLYAAHVSRIVDAVRGPVVLVGHSLGGMVASQTCESRPHRVALAIYLCAFLLPNGTSILEFYNNYLDPQMRGVSSGFSYDAEGLRSTIDPAAAIEVLYHHAERSIAETAARRLTPHPESARRSRSHLSEARFGSVPRVYIEALEDRTVHLALQRKMQELTPSLVTYALESDHAPHLSHPDTLTELFLKAIAENARAI